jgi:hypothetical protein
MSLLLSVILFLYYLFIYLHLRYLICTFELDFFSNLSIYLRLKEIKEFVVVVVVVK